MAYAHYGALGGACAGRDTPLDEVDPDLVGQLMVDKLEVALLSLWGRATAEHTFLANLRWLRDLADYKRAVEHMRQVKPSESRHPRPVGQASSYPREVDHLPLGYRG
jgi:hypothetical protein